MQTETQTLNMEESQINELGGCIDESGFLRNLYRKGFTFDKSFSELLANLIDAKSKNILIKITQTHIYFIENGFGMNVEKCKDMFAMNRSNHSNDKSIGVSGIGKVSLLILSGRTLVKLYTRQAGGRYLVVTIPWKDIFDSGIYTNMIKIESMNQEEIIEYQRERENMKVDDNYQGTTIKFEYNETLEETIANNFKSQADLKRQQIIMNPLNLQGVIFGHFDADIIYSHFQNPNELKKLSMYNYFGENNNSYYCGKSETTIQHYKNNKGIYRFICDINGEQVEIHRSGAGYNKEPKRVTKNLNGFEHIGDLKVTAGMRIDNNYFNIENPVMPTAENIMCEYDKAYFNERDFEFLCKVSLMRNNQFIGKIPLPDLKISSARANGETLNEVYHVRAELGYEPVSCNDNPQDICIGIQENKTQFNGEDLPINLTRLIRFIKKQKANEIWNYFKSLIAPQEENISEIANANDSDIEQEFEEEPEEQQQQQEIVELVPEFVNLSLEMPEEEDIPITPVAVNQEVENIIEESSIVQVIEEIVQNNEETTIIEENIEEDNQSLIEDSIVESEATTIQEEQRLPVNVTSYRRGAVIGNELLLEMQRIINNINPDAYYNEEYIKLFNLCKSL